MRRTPGLAHALVVIAGCLGVWGEPGPSRAAPHTDVLQPKRAQASREARAFQKSRHEARAHWPRFLTDPARRALHLQRGLLTRPESRKGRAGPDTARVLVARIGFETNRNPGLTSMDPSGDFVLDPDTTVVVDPPPHDARYFEAHLLAMKSYYEIVSDGALTIVGTVFPPQGAPSLKMTDMADYGPGDGGLWSIELLEVYFRDAIAVLDAGAMVAGLDLSGFDSILLAHPGSDLQDDIRRDSPNDLPTFQVVLADSVSVQNGMHEIRSGVVFPETLSQDGLIGGLLGTMCHEFGHELGLPDWYDTRIGTPVVGEWSLMDSGSIALFLFQVEGESDIRLAFGLLPTGLSAFDRVLLGWDDPYVIQAPMDQVTLRPSMTRQGTGPRTARLDISPDEYFLVENRRDFLAERAGDVVSCPYLNRDAETGVVLWMSRDDPNRPSRERTNSAEYDFFISAPSAPDDAFGECGDLGFGLLVWHVDERSLLDGLLFNTVNIDESARALRVIEASGDFEIGAWRQPNASFFGDGYNDPFRQGYVTELRSTTVPNNWNSDWAQTGWEISNVEFAAPESHTLSVEVRHGVAGWPQVLRSPADSLLPPFDVEGALVAEIAPTGPLVVLADSSGISSFGPGGRQVLYSGFVRSSSLASTPLLAPGDGVGTLAALDTTGVWLWDTQVGGGSLQVRAGFPLAIPGGTGERLLLLDAATGVPGGLVETAAGSWVRFTSTGMLADTYDLEATAREVPIVGPFSGTGGLQLALVSKTRVSFFDLVSSSGRRSEVAYRLDTTLSGFRAAAGRLVAGRTQAQVVVLGTDGRVRVVDPVLGVLDGYQDLPRDQYTGLALGDLTGDGELDVLATSATSLAGFTSRGARLLNTPRRLQETFAVRRPLRMISDPLVADVAGDSLPEILVTTDLGLVYALDPAMRPVEGFPRKMLPDGVPAVLLATDLDGQPETPEIVAVSAVSIGVVAPPGGSGVPGWTTRAGNTVRTSFVESPPRVGAAQRISRLEKPFLAYPNPTRDGVVQLRITSSAAGPYDLRIFTLEGEEVFAQRGQVQAGTQEIVWRCGSCASGVYLCRFVSKAAGVPSPLVEPITVLK